jgi:hypothetical protein
LYILYIVPPAIIERWETNCLGIERKREGQRTSHTQEYYIESERLLLLYQHDFPTPHLSLVAVCVSYVRRI